MQKQLKGLPVSVYRNPLGDCTNEGVSGKYLQLTLVGPGIDEVFTADENAPAVHLEAYKAYGSTDKIVRLVPVEKPAGKAGPMFGGNFAHTSDSRFHRAIEALTGHAWHGAVAIHDRFE